MCLLHLLRFRNVWIRESRKVVKFCVQTRFRHKTFQKWGKFIFFLFHCKFNVILTKTTIFARKQSQIKTTIFARKQSQIKTNIFARKQSQIKTNIFARKQSQIKTNIFARKQSQIKTNIFARKQIPSDIFIYYNNRSRLFCIFKIILSYYLNHKIQCI